MLLGSLTRDTLGEAGEASDPAKCVLVMHVHVLPSLMLLIDRLIGLGFREEAIIVVGKSYSTIPAAAADLAERGVVFIAGRADEFSPGYFDHANRTILARACHQAAGLASELNSERAILVDDGGLLSEVWYSEVGRYRLHVVSVQQTASGLFSESRPFAQSPFVKIDVARSAAKSYFEARIIAEGTFRAVESLGALTDIHRIGIVGLGRVGRNLAKRLSHRFEVTGYDRNRSQAKGLNVTLAPDAAALVQGAEVIFGCTGVSWLTPELLPEKGRRVFASCSSRDVEFANLLRTHRADPYLSRAPFGRLIYRTHEATHIVLNGGFPINFDRTREWEHVEEICLTRALVLLGILQALRVCPKEREQVYPLDAACQAKLTRRWMAQVGTPVQFFGVGPGEAEDDGWWERRSYRPTPY
jgi:hypothetical protein